MEIGLKDLYYAPVTVTNNVESFGTPVYFSPALSADLSVTTASAELYTDDALDEQIKQFMYGTLKLNIKELTATHLAALLGQTVDDDDVVYAGADNEPPFVAIGFRAAKTGGTYRYVWLYKVKFAVPDEKFQTKGSSITFNTPTITGTFYQLKKNAQWKADAILATTSTAAKGWFSTVRELASE